MQGKLQELTDKIYQEGINKAKDESERIIADAKSKADAIVKQAKKDAEGVAAQAKKDAENMRTNIDSEIRLAAQQAISKLKQEITAMITSDLIDQPLEKAFEDGEFIKKLVETVVTNWKIEGDQSPLELQLPADSEQQLKKYITDKGASKLKAEFTLDVEGGFKIGPADGGFKVSFTEEGFKNFFKEYLRPRASSFLFGEE